MSDVPISAAAQPNNVFDGRTMLLITGIGVVAFIAMLVLGAYAPDLRSAQNGGTHALSNSATGLSGLVRIAEATGRNPRIVRSQEQLKSEDLAVVTPDHGWTDLGKLFESRGPRVTLLVLPKWDTKPDPQRIGWVRVSGLLPQGDPARSLYPTIPLTIRRERGNGRALQTLPIGAPPELRFLAPAVLQTMSSNELEPVITDSNARMVLAKVKGRQLYVLADPDLINNHAMGSEQQARAALALLDYLNSTGARSIMFDVTTNGLGGSHSPLELAFDAPFVSVTLTIFVAMLLAGWQALFRFGPIRARERAIAFGKTALVDNSAALVRKAGRQPRLGGRYVEVIAERAIALFSVPGDLEEQTFSARLESLNPLRSFAAAAEAVHSARTRSELLAAAKLLHQWLEEVQQ